MHVTQYDPNGFVVEPMTPNGWTGLNQRLGRLDQQTDGLEQFFISNAKDIIYDGVMRLN